MVKNFEERYRNKLRTPEEALSYIKSGDNICGAAGTMVPDAIMSNLHKLYGRVEDIKIISLGFNKEYEFLKEEYKGLAKLESPFLMEAGRKASKYGMVNYIPVDLHMAVKRWTTNKKLNVFIGMATPMNERGFFSLGLENSIGKDFFDNADIRILEVNKNVPWVYGDTMVHIKDVDAIVEADSEIFKMPRAKQTETDKRIGSYVASLINDGDTLQIGIGGMGEAVASNLMDRKDLGIHTEMLNSCILDLVNAGVVTGRRKTLHKDKIISAFAMGDQDLYDFIDRNPMVELYSASYVNNPFVIAQNDNFVSINSTMAVDLLGQCASEMIGTTQYSGAGGQHDTAYGAIHSKNGRSIIMTPSTRKGGTISCIVPMHAPGAAITLGRNTVDYVVTEYGIAYLRGLSVRERMENLIKVAHPDFRDELSEAAMMFR